MRRAARLSVAVPWYDAGMWFAFRPVDMDFVARAPKVHVATADAKATRADVFRAFADPSTWHAWWPGLQSASYGDSKPPFGVGTFRESRVDGQRYKETMLAWDEGLRWAYRIDRATLPVASAQIESTELADIDGGTRITWTIAMEPRLMMRVLGPFFPKIMRKMLRTAARNLDAYLVDAAR